MLALLAAAAVAVAAIAQPPPAHPRTVVVTSAGPVRGRLHDGIVAFKGIPFAADPSGPRRWHPPQPPAPWSGTLDAVNFSSACAQSGGGYGPSTGEQRDGSSEDCLYLNVYTISAAGWASYLNSSFATLPGVHSTQEIAQLTSTLEGAFAADFAEAPLKAYKGLLSTFALTCAATVLAKVIVFDFVNFENEKVVFT